MKKITNLGRVATILLRQQAAEIFMHAVVSAFGAPSECHDDVSSGEPRRERLARKQAEAEAEARRPFRVIVRELKRRGLPIGSPRWDAALSRVYESAGYPF